MEEEENKEDEEELYSWQLMRWRLLHNKIEVSFSSYSHILTYTGVHSVDIRANRNSYESEFGYSVIYTEIGHNEPVFYHLLFGFFYSVAFFFTIRLEIEPNNSTRIVFRYSARLPTIRTNCCPPNVLLVLIAAG